MLLRVGCDRLCLPSFPLNLSVWSGNLAAETGSSAHKGMAPPTLFSRRAQFWNFLPFDAEL